MQRRYNRTFYLCIFIRNC